MTHRVFQARSLKATEPITFELCDETFRVPRKARTDLVALLASAITLDEQGRRSYPVDVLRRALINFIAAEVWDPTLHADGQREDEEPAGAWAVVDDRVRFITLLDSSRWDVDADTLGDVVMWLVEETTGHPTGAPQPSSAGREHTQLGSTESAG